MSERSPPHDPQHEPNAVVTDPEDFAQRERLRQIYDARQEFQQARMEADEIRSENGWPLWRKENYVLHAFQRYFFEVEGLMERHPKGDYYLEEIDLGRVEPVGVRGEDYDPADVRVFQGLRSLARDYRPMPSSGYTRPSDGRSRSGDTEVQVTVPESAVMLAFRKANEFLAEVGLDANMDGEKQDAGFDYSDILEEGPPEGDKPQLDDADDAPGGSDE